MQPNDRPLPVEDASEIYYDADILRDQPERTHQQLELVTPDEDEVKRHEVLMEEDDSGKESTGKIPMPQPAIVIDPAMMLKKQSALHQDDVLNMPLLVIIRHGKTEHNKLGLFTGWEDARLAHDGKVEASHAGQNLRRHGIRFDVVYTSWLSRAIETADIVLDELDQLYLPVVKTWRLNERMCMDVCMSFRLLHTLDGALTGLSKKMIQQMHGDDQYKKWRRGFDFPPPSISSFSNHYPGNDSRYVKYVKDLDISWFETLIRSLAHGKLEIHRNFPKTESLRDCMERTIPYFLNTIMPDSILPGKNVLIASSENAIRGLLMQLCSIPPDKIPSLEIPTGLPLIYDHQHGGRIRLLDDGVEKSLLERYNFGSNPELLFKKKSHFSDYQFNSSKCKISTVDAVSYRNDDTNEGNSKKEEIDYEDIIIRLKK